MKGRGLLIAAAIIQLIGAGFSLVSAFSSLLVMPAVFQSVPDGHGAAAAAAAGMMRAVGLVELIVAAVMVWVSIKLIQRRRWAWIVSLVMACLAGAIILLVSITGLIFGAASHARMGIGTGEGVVLFVVMFMVGTPVFAVVGLLIGGRAAVSAGDTQGTA
jgi:hypothetical protein